MEDEEEANSCGDITSSIEFELNKSYQNISQVQDDKQSRRLYIQGREAVKCAEKLKKIGKVQKVEHQENKAVIWYNKPVYIKSIKSLIKDIKGINVYRQMSTNTSSNSCFFSSNSDLSFLSESSSSSSSEMNVEEKKGQLKTKNNQALNDENKLCNELIDLVLTNKWNLVELLDHIELQQPQLRSKLFSSLSYNKQKVENALELTKMFQEVKKQQQNECNKLSYFKDLHETDKQIITSTKTSSIEACLVSFMHNNNENSNQAEQPQHSQQIFQQLQSGQLIDNQQQLPQLTEQPKSIQNHYIRQNKGRFPSKKISNLIKTSRINLEQKNSWNCKKTAGFEYSNQAKRY